MNKKKKVLISAFLGITVIMGALYPGVIGPNLKYYRANKLLSKGDWKNSIAIFKELGDFKESKKLLNKCYKVKLEEGIKNINTVDMCNTFSGAWYASHNNMYYHEIADNGDGNFALIPRKMPIKKYFTPPYNYYATSYKFSDKYVYFTLSKSAIASMNHPSSLYRAKLDGTEMKKIENNNVDSTVQLCDNKLYYTVKGNSYDKFCEKELSGDGTHKRVLLKKKNISYAYYVNGFVFYTNESNHSLHQYNVDTGEDITLLRTNCWQYCIDGDFIYYLGGDNVYRKSSAEGIDDDNIPVEYFWDKKDLLRLNRKTGKSKIIYKDVMSFQIKDDQIYLSTGFGKYGYGRIQSGSKSCKDLKYHMLYIDGSNTHDINCNYLCIYDNKIYYQSTFWDSPDETITCYCGLNSSKSHIASIILVPFE